MPPWRINKSPSGTGVCPVTYKQPVQTGQQYSGQVDGETSKQSLIKQP